MLTEVERIYQKEYKRRYRANNPDKHKSYWKQYELSNKEKVQASKLKWRLNNPERMMFLRCRSRAKDKDIEFNICLEDIVIPTHCPILGIPISISNKGSGHSDNSPSLDRIDSTKGYVKGNIQVISGKANRYKNDASFDDLITLGDWAWQQKVITIA